jgi:hypothetical protein
MSYKDYWPGIALRLAWRFDRSQERGAKRSFLNSFSLSFSEVEVGNYVCGSLLLLWLSLCSTTRPCCHANKISDTGISAQAETPYATIDPLLVTKRCFAVGGHIVTEVDRVCGYQIVGLGIEIWKPVLPSATAGSHSAAPTPGGA